MSNLLVQQMKAYAEYKSLITKAEGIFPTTQMFDNWKDKLTSAFNSNEPLDTFSFALTTFEAIINNQTSPYYQNDLSLLVQDPMFAEFTEIAQDLNNPYTPPVFSVDPTVSTAIAEEAPGTDLNMFETTLSADENFVQQELKQTNKVVLNINGIGIVENPEVLASSDGIIPKSQVTTNKIEQVRQENFALEAEGSSPAELEDLIDSYNIDSQTSFASSSLDKVESMPTNIDSKPASASNSNPEDELDLVYNEAFKKFLAAGGEVQEGEAVAAAEAPDMCQ